MILQSSCTERRELFAADNAETSCTTSPSSNQLCSKFMNVELDNFVFFALRPMSISGTLHAFMENKLVLHFSWYTVLVLI